MSDINDFGGPDEDQLRRCPEDTPSAALSEKQARFVTEYLVDRNAAAAAERAGYSPRSAPGLMDNEHIRLEIARRQTAAAQQSGISLESLIREVEAARQVAEENGNAAAMVSALKLKAELSGLLNEAAPPKPETEPPSKRELVKAYYDLMREVPDVHRMFREWVRDGLKVAIKQVAEEDGVDEAALYADFNARNFTLPSGPNSLLDVQEGMRAPDVSPAPALDVKSHRGTSHESAAPEFKRRLEVGERELVGDGGVYIQLLEVNCQQTREGDLVPGTGAQKYAVFDSSDELHGYRRSYDHALLLAESVAKSLKGEPVAPVTAARKGVVV
jgi:Terminase small subunit